MRRLACGPWGARIQSPRRMASRSMPARLSAQRWPALAVGLSRFWAWMLRRRTAPPVAEWRSVSPTRAWPAKTVPVTTVPWPGRVNTRSTARRNRPWCWRGAACCAVATRWARSAAVPGSSAWVAAVAKTGAPASGVGASRACTSSRTWAMRSGVARSALVRATVPCRTPSSSTMARCSRVWGITPSSAATTSSAWSMPTAPAAMVCTNFSWPGTSMMPRMSPGRPSTPGSGV